ncbi:DUF4279 domain-containing protein [Zavarzinia sp.]|uniref:DUF4279 domain-containing protein n=1 Tax=Zavarzinia sp. TaxID=2027920 RepID=UPI0035642497
MGNSGTNETKRTISVSLYLRGDQLDPNLVSEALGRAPDRSQRKGERQAGVHGREYIRKIGVWAIKSDPDFESNKDFRSDSVSDHVDSLLSKINFSRENLSIINDLEEVYIDIFVAMDEEKDGGGTCDFELSASQVEGLSKLGAPIRFTIAVIADK